MSTRLSEHPVWQRAEKMREAIITFTDTDNGDYEENCYFLFLQYLNVLYLDKEFELGIEPTGTTPGEIIEMLNKADEYDGDLDNYMDILYDVRSVTDTVTYLCFDESIEVPAASFLKGAVKDFPEKEQKYIDDCYDQFDYESDTYEDVRIALDIDSEEEWSKCVSALCGVYEEGTVCLEPSYTYITVREMPAVYSEYILHPERFRVKKKDKQTIRLFHQKYVETSGLYLLLASNRVFQTEKRLFIFATTGCSYEGRDLFAESMDIASVIQLKLIMELLESCRITTLEDEEKKKCTLIA